MMPGSVRCSVGPDGYDDQVSPPSSNYGGSTSSGPTRSNSIDSLPTNDKQVADYIPMRLTRPSPKTNVNAMQFVKVGPAVLHKTASEQLKKVEATKAMRKQIITEEEDWQSQTTDDRNSSLVEVTDWQSNLDKWKSSRRKRNEGALERVLEIKKNEVEDELGKTRRKSKTFSEMREEKRGRRFNLVVHDDDNNDLGDLGLSTYNDGTDTQGVKDVDQTYPVEDNKDAKSDAGFCTGSDTGSDGVFPEDNISDTSSALGDKKEAHDSLLDAGISKEEELHINGSMSSPVTSENSEYTYDKAIESYKQFAENSVKKRTSSITSLTSITSNNREDDYLSRNGRSASPSKTKIEDKLNFFKKEMKKEEVRPTIEPRVILRDKSPKVDVGKRRSMFEIGDPTLVSHETKVNAQVFELASRLEETPLVDNEEQPGMVGNVNETATVDHQDEFVRKVELVTVEETLDQHLYAQEPMEQVSPYNAPPEACPPVAPVLKQQQDAVDAPVAPILWQLQNDSVAPDPHPPLLQPLQPQLYQDDQHLEVEDNGKVYSDEDINEVINEYDGIDVPEDEKHETETCTENIYENITEEPLYENIYEKIDDTPEEPLQNEPHYQTIDEVHEATVIQEEKTVSKTTNHFVNSDPMEVLDVTWTEGSSLAAPPSEPPPPPPPDTEDDSDNSIEELVKDPKPQQSENFIRENSTRRIKKELWRRRSDFLGTSSKFVEEEQAVRPPPDLTELLRQEREAERRLLEAHSPQPFRSQPLVPQPPAPQELNEAEIVRREREIIESLERSEQQQQQQHLQQQHQEDLQASHDTNADLRGGEIQNPEAPLLRQDPYQEHTQYHQEHLEYQEDALTPQDSSPSEVKILTSETSANTEDNKISVCETPASTVQNVEPLPSPVLRDIEPPPSPTEPLTEHLEPRPFSDPNAEVITKAEEQPPGGDVSCSKTVARHQPETPEKLAELEAEMLEHDKAMLQRAGHSPSSPLPEAQHEPVTNFKPTPTADLPIQEFYTAPTFQPTPPPNFKSSSPPDTIGMLGMTLEHSASVGQLSSSVPNYTNLTAHPFSRSHSHTNLGAPTPYKSPPRVPKHQAPEPLPRKKKMPPPPPVKPAPAPAVPAPPPAVQQSVERQEAIRLSRQPTSALSEQPTEANTDNTSPSSPGGGQQMTKQTILALSAIPKPRLTDGDSWIMKRKQDSHRDYSKHWLLQEAEQRRIEQQERVQRPKTLHTSASQSPTMSSHHRVTTPPALHPVTTPPALHPVNTPPALHPASSQSTAHPVSIPPALHPVYTSSNSHSSSRTTSNNSNSSSNSTSNKWRNQATTYQPLAPPAKTGTDKPLPDSIIHSLTQRVNSRSINSNNNINNYSNANGRTSNYNSNYRDENYHDYMNADALSTVPTHTPLYQSSTSTPSPQHSAPSSSPQHLHHQQQQQTQDQKLLSVSGKKKCSHCTEELGRGAAMIIESLRLFYHIPCFKCCVCGIQLGNGSAGADVRVRNHKLHCHNCYSNDEGMKFSKV
ncbi:uncharacterized protein LOC143018276 isoform X15 [Oratosquilla oratoria]|uniref:uncharacterized protein LOC143018276 isoform X15 n=1 Tax=Oratosquilla oratoria TaxID=337810 RepID=UPI003F75EDDB